MYPDNKSQPSYGAPPPYSQEAPYPTTYQQPTASPYPTNYQFPVGTPYPTGDAAPTSAPRPDATTYNFTTSAFDDKSIRHAFIRKVYLILTAQLLLTGSFICVFLLVNPVKQWVRRNMWFYYISYFVFLITYIALVCCPGVRRRYPGNFIALSVFTLAFSYMTATISAYYSISSVLIAVGITGGLCLAISLFAIQTRIDLTKCSMLIFVVSVVFMLTGLACIIVQFFTYSPVLHAVYGGLGALVFGLYLAYDTQMIIGGRKYEMSPEDYIYGALQLYLDVVNLFMMLLSLIGMRDN